MVTLFKIRTLPFLSFFWIMVVQQCQNWETLDLALLRSWQLITQLSAVVLPLQCPGYHLLSWLVAEFYWCCPVSPLRVIRESVIESKIPKLSISPKWFIKRLHQFKTVDETALQMLGNYYWHLCGPVVLFALQIGLQRGEAQHGPETPQLRDAHIHQVWHAHIPREELTVFLLQNTNPGFLSLSV